MFRLIVLVVFFAGSACRAGGNLVDGPDADLIYNSETGFVMLDGSDTPSTRIVSFVLNHTDGKWTPVPAAYLPIFQPSACDCSSNKMIGATDLTLQGKRLIELGPILPTGMRTADELSDFFPTAKYAYAIGKGGDLDLIVVPETTGSVAVLMGCMVIALRRL